MTFKSIFIVSISLSVCSLVCAGQNNNYKKADLQRSENHSRIAHPKIEQKLYKFFLQSKNVDALDTEKYALESGIPSKGNTIKVCIRIDGAYCSAQSIHLENIIASIREKGGTIARHYLNLYEVFLPIDKIEVISEIDGIKFISLPIKPVEDIIVSEGVQLTGADYWIRKPSYKTADPVEIAMIDPGFAGYNILIGTELPADIYLVSYRSDSGPGTSSHGTLCTEIAYDMAPDARFFLMPIEDLWDLYNAVTYCIDNGIDVISTSLGWPGTGAVDGTGWTCDIMRYAADNGIIWATSAGNYRQAHHTSVWNDNDKDSWHNFSDDNEIMSFIVRPSTTHNTFDVFLEWEDWGTWANSDYSGTSEDFDLFVYKWTDAGWEIYKTSEDIQDGDDLPFEYLSVPREEGTYGVAIKRISGNKNVKLHITTYYAGPIDAEYMVSEGSISSGADSRDVITVGAFNASDLQAAYYSSMGPTRDGRIKPDISAPSSVSNFTAPGAAGTSISAPHAAGAIALILSRLPYTSKEDIIAILSSRAIEEGDPGKDILWGWGRLYLLP
jgi:hypothetical protein